MNRIFKYQIFGRIITEGKGEKGRGWEGGGSLLCEAQLNQSLRDIVPMAVKIQNAEQSTFYERKPTLPVYEDDIR